MAALDDVSGLDAVKALGRCSLAAALAVGACGAFGASASARATAVRISAPATMVAGAPCRVAVSVSRPLHATVLLQERDGRRWRTVSKRPLTRRSVTLRCPAAARVGRTRRFRALVRRGDRTIARSQVISTRVVALPAPPAPAGAAADPPAPPATPPAPAPRLDPAQFGVEGTGGPPSPETLALLGNPRIVLDDVGVADLRAGRIDPRIVAVLSKLAEGHLITVSAMCGDHPKLTAGGAISPHYLGRGVDIARIDGVPVSPSSLTARDVALGLSSLDAAYRPNEVGSPFSIAAPGYFTDTTTQDNLHIAFTQPIDPSWTPPTG
jgi:hypothetical protein